MNIERLRELFDLDAHKGQLLWRAKTSPLSRTRIGAVAGRPRKDGYWRVGIDGADLLVHRVVFAMAFGFLPDQVDHINGNRADNRPNNLRAATLAENQWNSQISTANASGVKGVCWSKRNRRWRATIRVEGRQRHIGHFDNLTDAADAVRAAREKFHGEFARHE